MRRLPVRAWHLVCAIVAAFVVAIVTAFSED
jgi:hypothetical protein